jgi:predicted pyridoxine 5'-phosphate oxidase superfamily flavin-nucleotide-binding protein
LIWKEFEAAAPELALPGRELLERFQFVLIGTLTRDGSPRVNPVEAYVVDGHLLVNMIPQSLKALDLLRDPRMYVHAPVTAKSGDPEFKIAGRAVVLEDDGLRHTLDELFWSMIEWRPRPDSHYFDLLAERAAYVTYGDQTQIALRWSVDGGVRRTEKPDI